MKNTGFGYGEVIYKEDKDFPEHISYNGCFWFRTNYKGTFLETGMDNFEYYTFERDNDLSLFIDAAGHIWDENELGIL